MKKTKIFFDTEFTGLHQNTTLISIALVAETGEYFYAEFTDYDKTQVDDWILENVIDKLMNVDLTHNSHIGINQYRRVLGDKDFIRLMLRNWLEQFEFIEVWSDCLSYDWVLFCQIFGHAFKVPKNVFYIPFDICTLFKVNGIDPDIPRESFLNQHIANIPFKGKKHNALFDAFVIRECYNNLSNNKK